MKIKFLDINVGYIDFDISQHHGIKTKDISYIVEYFDFQEGDGARFIIPTNHPKQVTKFFRSLQLRAKRNKTLQQQHSFVELREEQDKCALTFTTIHKTQRTPVVLYRHSFAKREWANYEELLLMSGLHISQYHESQIIEYVLDIYQATYTIVLYDEEAFAYVEAPSNNLLIESIAVIGKSILEGEIIMP